MSPCSHKRTFGDRSIGINIGDIVALDEGIFSDEVNLAVRS
jgi:class 3 adenylate cyclase